MKMNNPLYPHYKAVLPQKSHNHCFPSMLISYPNFFHYLRRFKHKIPLQLYSLGLNVLLENFIRHQAFLCEMWTSKFYIPSPYFMGVDWRVSYLPYG